MDVLAFLGIAVVLILILKRKLFGNVFRRVLRKLIFYAILGLGLFYIVKTMILN